MYVTDFILFCSVKSGNICDKKFEKSSVRLTMRISTRLANKYYGLQTDLVRNTRRTDRRYKRTIIFEGKGSPSKK